MTAKRRQQHVRSEASRLRNARRAARRARERNGSTRYARCKRCGGLGHTPRTCTMPPVAGGRPDVERIVGRVRRGEAKSVGGDKVIAIVEYLYAIEGQRRQLITLMREQLPTPR